MSMKLSKLINPVVKPAINEETFADNELGEKFFKDLNRLMMKYKNEGLNQNVAFSILSNYPNVKFI